MAKTRDPHDMDPSERIDTALNAAAEASERFTQAKTDLLHRLADIDGAMVEIVQRVYDTTPPEFQRSYVVHIDGDDEELELPDFLRLLLERAGGTRGTFTIRVAENLYDDGDGEEGDEVEEEDEEEEEEQEDEEEDDDEDERPAPSPPPPPPSRRRSPPPVDEEDDELGF